MLLDVMPLVKKDPSGKVVSYGIIVNAFIKQDDGTAGLSETAGIIHLKDFIVGVNGTDLSRFPFKKAMKIISEAAWPKTVHFLRNSAAAAVRERAKSPLRNTPDAAEAKNQQRRNGVGEKGVEEEKAATSVSPRTPSDTSYSSSSPGPSGGGSLMDELRKKLEKKSGLMDGKLTITIPSIKGNGLGVRFGPGVDGTYQGRTIPRVEVKAFLASDDGCPSAGEVAGLQIGDLVEQVCDGTLTILIFI